MKMILWVLTIVLGAAALAHADVPPYSGVRISTITGQADSTLSGRFKVAASSVTASTPTIVLDGVMGGVNASSGTFKYGVKAATGVFSGAVTAGSGVFSGAISVPSSSVTASAFFGDGSHLTGITGVPTGAVMAFNLGAATCPSGWALCNGSGGTPDLRGMFIRGAGSNGTYTTSQGATPAATFGAEQADTIQAHVHEEFLGNTGSQTGNAGGTYTPLVHSAGPSNQTGSTGGNETRPINYALTYCQKQ